VFKGVLFMLISLI